MCKIEKVFKIKAKKKNCVQLCSFLTILNLILGQAFGSIFWFHEMTYNHN